MSDNSEENNYTTQQIRQLQKFIESSPLVKENRGVFAVAVCVGILLEVQEILYNKVAPFWQRLNRLDLDLYRVKEFYPEVKSKLAMYREKMGHYYKLSRYRISTSTYITTELQRLRSKRKFESSIFHWPGLWFST
jgi:hypothetical protein